MLSLIVWSMVGNFNVCLVFTDESVLNLEGSSTVKHCASLALAPQWGASLPLFASVSALSEQRGVASQVSSSAPCSLPGKGRDSSTIPPLLRRVDVWCKTLHSAVSLLPCQWPCHARNAAYIEVSIIFMRS